MAPQALPRAGAHLSADCCVFSSRRRHERCLSDWSSDVCSSDLPPPRLVTSGVYSVIPHPIYTGFCLLCVALAMAARSRSGLWLVCPVVMLGCVSLVLGYERPDLDRRFGEGKVPRPPEWVRYYLFALLPWIVVSEIV